MDTRERMETGALTGKREIKDSFSERYTDAARAVVAYARCEALDRDSEMISVADLLAGLSCEENTRAERIGSLKANALYLRWLAGSPLLPSLTEGRSCQDESHRVELGAEAKQALAYAVQEADRDREYWIDTDHLLRGLMCFPNKAHFAVLKTELNLKAARVASRRDREEYLPDETPNFKVVQYLARKHFSLWLSPVLSLACYLYILIQTIGQGGSLLAR